jgi:hypothetical protein
MDFRKVSRVNFAFFQTDVQGNIWGTDSWADREYTIYNTIAGACGFANAYIPIY